MNNVSWLKEKLKYCRKPKTPFILFDLSAVEHNYKIIQRYIKNAKIFFAVKSNHHTRILQKLIALGSCFEVASGGELKMLIKLRVNPEKISFSNPVKNIADIKLAYSYGVRLFVYDSLCELMKLKKYAPESKGIIRLNVRYLFTNLKIGSMPFLGIKKDEALDLLLHSLKLEYYTAGITFHVGSLTVNPIIWRKVILYARDFFIQAKKIGCQLEILNLGGGFPSTAQLSIKNPSKTGPEYLYKFINNEINKRFFHSRPVIIVEPGVGLVANAGILIASVICIAKRGKDIFVHIDVGSHNGLGYFFNQFPVYIIKQKLSQNNILMQCAVNKLKDSEKIIGKENYKKNSNLSAVEDCYIIDPTCDANLVMSLKGNIECNLGDWLCFEGRGAYSNVLCSEYNGMPRPRIIFKE